MIVVPQEKSKISAEDLQNLQNAVVEKFLEYLESYQPKGQVGKSKHALMGPAGKLLTLLTRTGEINWEYTKGYILNVHRNQQDYVPLAAIESLDQIVEHLKELREKVSLTQWLRLLEEIDYAVFFHKYRQDVEGRQAALRKEFLNFISQKFENIGDLNERYSTSFEDFESISDPFTVDSRLNELVDEFWKDRKKRHKNKEEKN